MDLGTSLQINALAAVLDSDSDPEYRIRTIFRWYSKTFHTPLHEVEELPLDDVLVHYYESKYEDLVEGVKDDRPLAALIRTLTETDEERLVRALRKSEDDAVAEKLHRMEESKETLRRAAASAKKRVVTAGSSDKNLNSKLVSKAQPLIPGPDDLPPDLSFSKPLSIAPQSTESPKVKYVDTDEFERMIDRDSVVQPPKRR